MSEYERRKAQRIARYRKRAKEAEIKSLQMSGKSHKMIKAIPLGQPIMVGHHSEKSDRNYRNRAWRLMEKSIQEDDKAAYYDAKARAAENNTAISSDDPKALEKLRAKLQELVDWQVMMKQANMYYRKHGTCVGFPGMSDEVAAKYDEKVAAAYSWNKQPFASYTLTNNSAVIRSTKARIEKLEARDKSDREGWEFDGGRVYANKELNRLQILFDEKPSDELRGVLKRNGFHWAPSEKAWQRQLNGNAWYALKYIKQLAPIENKDEE